MSAISQSLRQLVVERAQGCCEYCLLSQADSLLPFEIDHIVAVKHRGLTVESNLCLSCPNCNAFKGSDIASVDLETNQLVYLFNPRQQQWGDHFRLDSAMIIPLSPEGRVTEFILRLNQPEQIEERRILIELNRYPCRLRAE